MAQGEGRDLAWASALALHTIEQLAPSGADTEADTDGCPLLAMNRTATGVNNCAPAVAMIKTLVRQAIAEGEQCWITVANP